ncbi:metal-dependent hydrolase [Pseudoalteromonas shioyasakiensis]|uniref:metal-dependent hydrolase n=1 Tax=Pseudoalteromonas shioyasakiensis TaxID=1190813 RepID=UPI001EFE41A9|nr:metal-dependent hydrolase [Pseudoalteromonas shioyasakiensis]MCG9736397.1 metal-dependent hydrolase [Pseudoalteromonas shioyasakiensis]
MDSITHGLLAAGITVTVAKLAKANNEEIKAALFVGVLAGLIPDLDVIIRSASDPLLEKEFHRQFSHSLLFLPLGSALAAWGGCWLMNGKLTVSRSYYYAMLAYLSHILLDANTSYGTQLLWPFSSQRYAWDGIAIIDPVVTCLLGIHLWLRLSKAKMWVGHAVASLIIAYFGLGVVLHHSAISLIRAYAQGLDHQVERIRVMPMLPSLISWRSVYRYQDNYYVNGLKITKNGFVLEPGGKVPRFKVSKWTVEPQLSPQQQIDIKRFQKFSDDWLSEWPGKPHYIGDIRYSNYANSVIPLWGIELSSRGQGQHVKFRRNTQ